MSNDDKRDVMTIEFELSSHVEKLKWDKDALATFPCLLERLRQYVKDRGSKKRWCPDCYITKEDEECSNPWVESWHQNGIKHALYECRKCGFTIKALR